MPVGEKMHVRKGDTVRVLAGKDRNHTGKVLSCEPRRSRVIVEGANMVKKHTKPKGRVPGGIIDKPAPIHISNVMLICPGCALPSRMKHIRNADGQRERVCRRCGQNVDQK
jgi:large subunit ribosomal protein L24